MSSPFLELKRETYFVELRFMGKRSTALPASRVSLDMVLKDEIITKLQIALITT